MINFWIGNIDITKDRVQPRTSNFSSQGIIWVKHQVVSQLSQLNFLLSSYLNRARHNSGIELYRELKLNLRFYSKLTHSFC